MLPPVPNHDEALRHWQSLCDSRVGYWSRCRLHRGALHDVTGPRCQQVCASGVDASKPFLKPSSAVHVILNPRVDPDDHEVRHGSKLLQKMGSKRVSVALEHTQCHV